jgi:NAD(P)-dependent dehydrogenase (short-subunit alcohol dehydrogenase family)
MSVTQQPDDPAPDTAPIPASLQGRTVLVAGAGRHMGLAVARAAAAWGARVVMIGRDEARTEAAAQLVRAAAQDEVVVELGDVADSQAAEQLLRRHGGFDHLAITISTGASASSIPATSQQAARAPFDNRFWPTYQLLHAAPRHMSAEGSITLTSGSSGRRPQAGFGVYGTLHAALNGLAIAAAIELIPHPGQARDFGAIAVALMVNPAITGTIVDVDGGEFLGAITDD